MTKPRVGFLGVGWIGRHRMEAMLAGGMVEAVAVCDPSPAMINDALQVAPRAEVTADLDALLACGLDAVVIATPSALHAEQAIACLEAGAAVFCQKPLGRDAAEVARAVDAARRVGRRLTVDFSYRHTEGVGAIERLVQSGTLGRVFAIDLVFHNAFGPDKPWFYDRARAGGGCLMDLGSHLVDLAHRIAGASAAAEDVSSTLFCKGLPLTRGDAEVEDYATASFSLAGIAVRLACSWRLHAGVDAVIAAECYGTAGGVALRNVAGSFYDFEATRFTGTARETLAAPPDAWGARAATAWASDVSRSPSFCAAADDYVVVAQTIDSIYEAGFKRTER